LGTLGLAPLLFVLTAVATAATDTVTSASTGDSGAPTTTFTTGGTGALDNCAECFTASELDGEKGGSPCHDGCTHGGGSWSTVLLAAAGSLVLRRRKV
jgi:uncharacterized protein (TIGR03382 family)